MQSREDKCINQNEGTELKYSIYDSSCKNGHAGTFGELCGCGMLLILPLRDLPRTNDQVLAAEESVKLPGECYSGHPGPFGTKCTCGLYRTQLRGSL